MRSSLRLQDTALRYFLEVVRTGSVSEAATRLSVSPSAVSRQVATLEDLLGVPLFERRPRGMAPSPAGELLAAHALRNALEADRVVADIEALQGLRRGLIRVCCSAGFAIEFLPKAMAQFREQHPGMQFHLRVAAPAAVTQAVLNIEAGIGLTYSRTAERDIELQTLAGRTLPEGVRAFIAHLRQQLPPPDRQCGAMDPPACRQAEPHTVLTR